MLHVSIILAHKKIKCLCVFPVWCGSQNFVCAWNWA